MTSSIGVVQSHQCMSDIISVLPAQSKEHTEYIHIGCAQLLQRCFQRHHHTLDRVSGPVDLVGVLVNLLIVYVGGVLGSDNDIVSNTCGISIKRRPGSRLLTSFSKPFTNPDFTFLFLVAIGGVTTVSLGGVITIYM
jgi:hypothetical protein